MRFFSLIWERLFFTEMVRVLDVNGADRRLFQFVFFLLAFSAFRFSEYRSENLQYMTYMKEGGYE